MKYSQLRDETIESVIPPMVEFTKIMWGDQIRHGIVMMFIWFYSIPVFMIAMVSVYAIVFVSGAVALMSVAVTLIMIAIGLLIYPKINRFAQRVEDRGGKDPVKSLKHPPRAITR